jgi:hypothetical protein
MQQPGEVYAFLKEVEAQIKSENTNIKNKRFVSLFEYLQTQSESSGSKLTQWEKDIAKGTKVFNFILFHRGTVEHMPTQFEALCRELHQKFYKSYLSKMTTFWNFVALGHSQTMVVQKKNFNHILPGFRLFCMEPPADDQKGIAGESDVRSHLTQLFYRNSLPFQKLVIHQPSVSMDDLPDPD